jgi:uncharacterized membrane protein YgcG
MAALGKEVNLRAEGSTPAETSETWMQKSQRWLTMPDGKYALDFICRKLRAPEERFGTSAGVAPEGWVSSITFGTDGESSEVWFDCTFPNLEGGGGSMASVSHAELVRLLVEDDAETTAKREARNVKSATRRADAGGDKFLKTGAGEIALNLIGRRVVYGTGLEDGTLVYGTVVVVTCKRNAVARENFTYTCIFDNDQSTEAFKWKQLKKMLQSEDERETVNMPEAPTISREKRRDVLSSAVEQAKLVVMKLPPPKKPSRPRRPRGIFSSCFYCLFSPCLRGSGTKKKKKNNPNYTYDYYYDPYYSWYFNYNVNPPPFLHHSLPPALHLDHFCRCVAADPKLAACLPRVQEPSPYYEGWTYLYPDYHPEEGGGGHPPTSYLEYEAAYEGGGDAGGWFGDWGAGDGGDGGGWGDGGDGGDGGGWGDGGGDGGGGGGDGGGGGGD